MDQQAPPDLRAQLEVLDSLVLPGLSAQRDSLEPLETRDLRGLQARLEILDNRAWLGRLEHLEAREPPDRLVQTEVQVRLVLQDHWDNRAVLVQLDLAVRLDCLVLLVYQELPEYRDQAVSRAPLDSLVLSALLGYRELLDCLVQPVCPDRQDQSAVQDRLEGMARRVVLVHLELLVLLAIQERQVSLGL